MGVIGVLYVLKVVLCVYNLLDGWMQMYSTVCTTDWCSTSAWLVAALKISYIIVLVHGTVPVPGELVGREGERGARCGCGCCGWWVHF